MYRKTRNNRKNAIKLIEKRGYTAKKAEDMVDDLFKDAQSKKTEIEELIKKLPIQLEAEKETKEDKPEESKEKANGKEKKGQKNKSKNNKKYNRNNKNNNNNNTNKHDIDVDYELDRLSHNRFLQEHEMDYDQYLLIKLLHEKGESIDQIHQMTKFNKGKIIAVTQREHAFDKDAEKGNRRRKSFFKKNNRY